MKAALIIAGALMANAPAEPQGFDWHRPADRILLDGALSNFARSCGDFGFTIVARNPSDVMEKRLYAHFLLERDYEVTVELGRWVEYVQSMEVTKQSSEKSAAMDAAKALKAVEVDPSSEAKAHAQFVAAFEDVFRPWVQACERAANDPFLKENYVTGSGSMKRIDEAAEENWSHRNDRAKK